MRTPSVVDHWSIQFRLCKVLKCYRYVHFTFLLKYQNGFSNIKSLKSFAEDRDRMFQYTSLCTLLRASTEAERIIEKS